MGHVWRDFASLKESTLALLVEGKCSKPIHLYHNLRAPDDEYQWLKYGQKDLAKSNLRRCYFRCRQYKDKACKAKCFISFIPDEQGDFHVEYHGIHNHDKDAIHNELENSLAIRSQTIINHQSSTPPNLQSSQPQRENLQKPFHCDFSSKAPACDPEPQLASVNSLHSNKHETISARDMPTIVLIALAELSAGEFIEGKDSEPSTSCGPCNEQGIRSPCIHRNFKIDEAHNAVQCSTGMDKQECQAIGVKRLSPSFQSEPKACDSGMDEMNSRGGQMPFCVLSRPDDGLPLYGGMLAPLPSKKPRMGFISTPVGRFAVLGDFGSQMSL